MAKNTVLEFQCVVAFVGSSTPTTNATIQPSRFQNSCGPLLSRWPKVVEFYGINDYYQCLVKCPYWTSYFIIQFNNKINNYVIYIYRLSK